MRIDHAVAQLGADGGARRLFDQLLMAALQRALALAERPHLAVLVGERLELDVARRLDEALEVELGVLEGAHGLGRRGLEGAPQVFGCDARCACRARRRRRAP